MRAPQLLPGHTFGLVPETMSRNSAWLQPLRKALLPLHAAGVEQLFHCINRGEGAQEVPVHHVFHAVLKSVCQLRLGAELRTNCQ